MPRNRTLINPKHFSREQLKSKTYKRKTTKNKEEPCKMQTDIADYFLKRIKQYKK